MLAELDYHPNKSFLITVPIWQKPQLQTTTTHSSDMDVSQFTPRAPAVADNEIAKHAASMNVEISFFIYFTSNLIFRCFKGLIGMLSAPFR